MAFWGCSIKAGQKHKAEIPAQHLLHLSQACLQKPSPGKTFLQVQANDSTYTVGHLEKEKVETLALDLFFSAAPTFVNTGKSDLHLSGYTEPQGTGEEYQYDDDEEPAEKPAKKAASPKVVSASAKAAQDDEEEEEEEEEGDESEEEEEEAPTAKAAPAKKDKKGKEAAAAAAAAPEKRKAPEAPAPAAKKAKGGDAPGSPKAAAPAGGDEDGYVKALVEYLKKNGKTKLSDLGSKVKRPEGTPKMKAIFAKHAGKFAVDGDAVALK